jgi:hypothetical protein
MAAARYLAPLCGRAGCARHGGAGCTPISVLEPVSRRPWDRACASSIPPRRRGRVARGQTAWPAAGRDAGAPPRGSWASGHGRTGSFRDWVTGSSVTGRRGPSGADRSMMNAMSKLRVQSFALSLDGYGADSPPDVTTPRVWWPGFARMGVCDADVSKMFGGEVATPAWRRFRSGRIFQHRCLDPRPQHVWARPGPGSMTPGRVGGAGARPITCRLRTHASPALRSRWLVALPFHFVTDGISRPAARNRARRP